MATPITQPHAASMDKPALTLVKQPPEPGTVEGTVVEHADARPAWIHSSRALAERAAGIARRTYLPHALRGYGRLARRWADGWSDDYPQMIHSARGALKAAKGDVAEEAKMKKLVRERRRDYRMHRLVYSGKTLGWGAAASAGATAAVATGGALIDLLTIASVYAIGAWHGRDHGQTTAAAAGQALDAPPPALDEQSLTKALRDIGMPADARILSSTQAADGTSTTIVDLTGAATVTALQKKLEELAASLGRDTSMVDITKAGKAGRACIWMSDQDPFAAPRPSPLLTATGSIDAFKGGVPVAWNKRGTPVHLPINNSSFVIAGMTRSGKGVGAANLAAGAAMDPRINLRVVAGKTNGEWDAYARAGVAATYFKPNPHRLLALLKALSADMDRRNKILGELGKSKLTPETIVRLGGIELLVIDELATYTRSGNPLRDDILKELTDLSAVAAGAGILLVLITQYPEVGVLPQGLAMNCGTRWAMRVDNASQSNAILGGGASSSGRDASKFDPPLPGLGWLVNPFAGVTDMARSFDLDEDERGEISELMVRAAKLRENAGRLVGQWQDPIETRLAGETGLSSAAGGPQRNGEPGVHSAFLTAEQRQQVEACHGALAVMDDLGRDVAQLDELARGIGGSMTADWLGDLLRGAGAGGTVKVPIDGRRVNGYRREDIDGALGFLKGE